MKIEGTLKKVDIGNGAWVIETNDDKKYQLFLRKFPKELLVEGNQLIMEGVIRDDIMTTAMVGPVFEMQSYEIIS